MLVVTCARNGGHLAPNLGVVELTLALHRVLDLPKDKFVWDVSHQSYVHKILTGPPRSFPHAAQGRRHLGLRDAQRIRVRSVRRRPREHVGFGRATAWRSRAISSGGNETIVAVLGDGALTGGLAYEALNNAGGNSRPTSSSSSTTTRCPSRPTSARWPRIFRCCAPSRSPTSSARRAKDVLGHIPFGGAARKALRAPKIGAMRFVAPVRERRP